MKTIYLFIILLCVQQIAVAQLNVIVTPSNTTICAGSSLSVTASVGTSDPVTYSWSPSTGLNTTTGATVVASPIESITYTVTATNTITSETGTATVTLNISGDSYTLAGTAGGPAICQNNPVDAAGTTFRDGCKVVATVIPNGSNPVTGIINTCMKIDTGANKMGSLDLYLARRYDIEPATDPDNVTANVTLYYLQSEFDNYNAKSQDSGLYNLPTGPGDVNGINNMRIRQFHGTGTQPGQYTGNRIDFKSNSPGVSITWNASRAWWEITVPVNGFSGFYISSRKGSFAVLPVKLEYFKGTQAVKQHNLTWKVNSTSEQAIFELERSDNGLQYTKITQLIADQARCATPFQYIDASPLEGKNYYRLKITDADGKSEYSNIIQMTLKTRRFDITGINPTIVNSSTVLNITAKEKSELVITVNDMAGRRVQNMTVQLRQGTNKIKLNTVALAPGLYSLRGFMAGEEPQTVQFIKE